MNTKNKIIYSCILIVTYIFFVSFYWPYIELPFNKSEIPDTFITSIDKNPLNDTFRFVLFLFPPLIIYIFTLRKFNKNILPISTFFYFNKDKNEDTFLKINEVFLLYVFFIAFIFLEFLQLDFPNNKYLDTLHDGDYLAAIKNHLAYGGFWSSSFTVHGGENIFIPLMAEFLFGTSITNLKYSIYIFIFLIKFFSIILSFQIIQLSKLSKNCKIIFFTLLTFFILSLSKYNEIAYLNIRDIFVLIFFIFLINLYLKGPNFFNISIITFASVFGFAFHYDTGTYLNFIIIIIFFNFLFAKKIKILLILTFAYLINWILLINIFGLNEIGIMFEQFFQIANYIDIIHGIEFPQPFFSIGDGENGTRATKTLILLLMVGFITINVTLTKNNYFSKNEKIFLIILYIYSIISFKNALGRSDGPHIMLSSDWISILLFFYFLHYLFYKFLNQIKFDNNLSKKILYVGLLIVISFNLDLDKLKNYKVGFEKNLANKDKTFLTKEREIIVKEISSFINNEKCIQNFTKDLSLPYLLNKPNCTSFIAPWLASGKKFENKFISELKNKKVKYVIFQSPAFIVDEIKTSDRLVLVNDYISKNYTEFFNQKEYIIYKLKK